MFVCISIYVRIHTCVCMHMHVSARARVCAHVHVPNHDKPSCLPAWMGKNACRVAMPCVLRSQREAQDIETLCFSICKRSRCLGSRRFDGGTYKPFANCLQHEKASKFARRRFWPRRSSHSNIIKTTIFPFRFVCTRTEIIPEAKNVYV